MFGYAEKYCSVGRLLWLVQRICQPIGAAPVTLTPNSEGWVMSVSKRMSYYGYIFTVAVMSTLAVGLYTDATLEGQNSLRMRNPSSTFLWSIDVGPIMVICSLAAINAPQRMSAIIRHLNKLSLIKSQLNYQSSGENKQCVVTSICSCFAILLFYLDFTRFDREIADREEKENFLYFYTSYYICKLLILFLEIQYIFVGFQAPDTLQKLNDEIEMILSKKREDQERKLFEKSLHLRKSTNALVDTLKPTEIVVNFYSKSDHDNESTKDQFERDRVRKLVTSYVAIVDTARRYHNECTQLVLSLLLIVCVHLMVTPYYYIVFLLNSTELKTTTLLLQPTWFAYHLAKLILLVEPGERLESEMKRTHIAVSHMIQWVNAGAGDHLVPEIEHFYKQVLLHHTSFFTPLGLCTMRRGLVIPILHALLSYPLVWIQFQLLEVRRKVW